MGSFWKKVGELAVKYLPVLIQAILAEQAKKDQTPMISAMIKAQVEKGQQLGNTTSTAGSDTSTASN